MRKPWYQKTIIAYIPWILAGFLLIGSILDTVSNTAEWISSTVTYIGTLLILVALILLKIFLARKPITWITDDGTKTKIKALGLGPLLVAVGLILALWVPRFSKLDGAVLPIPSPTPASTLNAPTSIPAPSLNSPTVLPTPSPTPASTLNAPTSIPAPILSSPAAMSCINSGYALRVINSLGGTIYCEYTDRGLLSAVTDSQGNTTRYIYDIANRLTEYTDAQGNTTKYNLTDPDPSEIPTDNFAFGPTPTGNQKGGVDGIFYRDLGESRSNECDTVYKFIRLYKDGLVLDTLVCSDADESIAEVWSRVSKWFNRESDVQVVPVKGEFHMLDQYIWFSTTGNNAVTIDYFGMYLDDRIILDQFYYFDHSRANDIEYLLLEGGN